MRFFISELILGALDSDGFCDFRIFAHETFGRFFGDFNKILGFPRFAVSRRLWKRWGFSPQREETDATNVSSEEPPLKAKRLFLNILRRAAVWQLSPLVG